MPVYLCSTNKLAVAICREQSSTPAVVVVIHQADGAGQDDFPAATRISWAPPLRPGDLMDPDHEIVMLAIGRDSSTDRHAAAVFLAECAGQGLPLVFAPAAITLAGQQAGGESHASALPGTQVFDTLEALYAAAIQIAGRTPVQRLMALDGESCVCYLPATRQLSVQGPGSAFVATLHHQPHGDPVTFTIDVVTAGTKHNL